MNVGLFAGVYFDVRPDKVLTFDNMKIKRKAKFAKHKILNGKDLIQHTGTSIKEIRFKFSLLSSLGVDPEEEVKKLAKALEAGKARTLVINNSYVGHFHIKSFTEKHIYKERRIDIDIKLLEANESL